MKKIFYFSVLLVFTSACTTISEKEAEEFIVSHFEEKVGGELAIESFIDDFDESLDLHNLATGWSGTPKWVANKSLVTADWFYEDSVVTNIKSIEVFGSVASVYGNAKSYVSGIETYNGNFHSLVSKEKGKIIFKRHAWASSQYRRTANSFVWPSTEVEGALSMYNRMRYAIINMRTNDAKLISDSLVKLDPNLAVAHLGQINALWMDGKREELNVLLKESNLKLDSASQAEKYTLGIFYPSKSAEEMRLKIEKALLFASADPMLRGWHGYWTDDIDDKIATLNEGLFRYPESSILNNIMGYTLMEQNKLEEAFNHFNIYITVHPDEPNAYDSMGDCFLAKGDSSKAKEMFLKAFEMNDSFTASKEKADKLN
jgi:tetratricopeptide (TPR) repeat protein